VLDPPESKKGLGPLHVIFQDPAAVFEPGVCFDAVGPALGAKEVDQDFPGQKVIPATQIGGVAAAGAEAAEVEAHGLTIPGC